MNIKQWNSLKKDDIVKDEDNNIYTIIGKEKNYSDKHRNYDLLARILDNRFETECLYFYTGICLKTLHVYNLYKPKVYQKVKNYKLIRLLYI